jgi:hypothetical protein
MRRSWVVAWGLTVSLAVAGQVPWTQSGAVLPRRLALHALAVLCLLHAARRLRMGSSGALACALAGWQALTWAASEMRWLGLPRLMDGVAALALLVAVAGGRLPLPEGSRDVASIQASASGARPPPQGGRR